MSTAVLSSSSSTGPGARRVRLLVVDDHPVVRSGIVGMFSSEADLAVVGEAADGDQAVELVAELAPDVVLMDLRMPGVDGVEAIRRISAGAGTAHGAVGAGTAHGAVGAGTAAHAPAPRIVVLTTYDTDGDILRAVEAGAIGYLLKDSAREDILAAVRAAAVGRSALSPTVTTRLLGAARGAGQSAAGAPRGARVPVSLSPREREVLAAVSRGLSNSQIGVELYITEATVKTHLLRAYAKLGVDSRAAAVTEALRRGLLELD
ncbi:response regulator [Actinomyces massiliensis]|uniref:response regulator n=2 Tax=Actinomyces massiliensis TaxID=461393 RepID=UPI0009DB3B14|nr:response regulator transcription factor [Actinomyces massiliensis]